MTQDDFEQRLRAELREMATEASASALRASVLAIPDAVPATPDRLNARGWRFSLMSRFSPIVLAAAAALVLVVVVGAALFMRPSPDIGPSPSPGQTDSATAEPSATEPTSSAKPAATASWTVTGSMIEARVQFTATRLLDGRVLVTGGERGFDAVPRALASAELYDPATGTWSATGSMLQARFRHTATLLPDGKVLVAGGSVNSIAELGSGCCLATAEIYDPATGTWTAARNLISARTGHIAELLPDGMVLVAGGDAYRTGLSETPAEVYDPATGTWSPTGGNYALNHDQFSTLLTTGMVFVTGGSGLGGPTQLYDPVDGSWSVTDCCEVDPVGEGPPNGSVTRLADGMVLVAGGTGHTIAGSGPSRFVALDAAVLYDPRTSSSTATASLHAPREDRFTATLLPNGMVLVVGGVGGGDGTLPTEVLATGELYDPSTGTWTETASLKEARHGQQAVLLTDGAVLVMGGLGSEILVDPPTSGYASPILASAELYTWGGGE